MGIGGLHIWHLLIILLICVVMFGTKRLKDVGSDLGAAVRGFREAMGEADRDPAPPRRLAAGEARADGTRPAGDATNIRTDG